MKKPTKKKSVGLGDTVAKITEATGIYEISKFILGEDCGCDKRQAKLNKFFPYKKADCLIEKEYDYLNDYFERNTDFNNSRPSEIKELTRIYDRVFDTNTNCSNCFPEIYSSIKKIYETY